MVNKYSLLMHRIKIKSPANFFMEWIKRFCGRIYHFSINLTLVVLQRQKSLPYIGGTTIQDVGCHLAAMRQAKSLTYVDLWKFGHLWTNINEVLIKIDIFPSREWIHNVASNMG